jgi:single-strand DNA-binding protein
MNHVQLIGNLGANPQIKFIETGKKVANFSIAITERIKQKDGNVLKNTQWHKVVAWGALAQIVEQFLQKGSKVTIDGKLSNRTFTDANGKKHTQTEIVAKELLIMNDKVIAIQK